jgi:uncharacterized protein (DUF433 family)
MKQQVKHQEYTGIIIANPRKAHKKRNPAAIVSDPQILGGTPTLAGSRIPAASLLDYLGEGYTVDEFVEEFEVVTATQCQDALQQLREALNDGLLIKRSVKI